jgi:hypothetical protein
MNKTYLGDSVYAESDGFGLWLTTENGYGPSNKIYNKIYLEPEVIHALDLYREYLKKIARAQSSEEES